MEKLKTLLTSGKQVLDHVISLIRPSQQVISDGHDLGRMNLSEDLPLTLNRDPYPGFVREMELES